MNHCMGERKKDKRKGDALEIGSSLSSSAGWTGRKKNCTGVNGTYSSYSSVMILRRTSELKWSRRHEIHVYELKTSRRASMNCRVCWTGVCRQLRGRSDSFDETFPPFLCLPRRWTIKNIDFALPRETFNLTNHLSLMSLVAARREIP